MSFVSYAQNFEDVLLHRVFGGQETGFYVDAGAYHPVASSVTKALYDRGWSGINIEPGSVFAELAAARPRDVNLQMALLDRAGEIAFIENQQDRGTSHVVLDQNSTDSAVRMVPCDTLEAVIAAHAGGRPVDLVKIDVEGAEAAIVRSTDWRRLRPLVLLLEATLPWSSALANQDWESVLLEQEYVRAYFDGINCFYIPQEAAPALQRCFQVPVNVLDRVVRHEEYLLRAGLEQQQSEATRLAVECQALAAALNEQRSQAAQLGAECQALRAAKDEQQGEREALRTALDAQQTEAARLADSLRQLEVRLAPPPAAAVGPPVARRRAAKRAARSVYRLLRPVARPLAWRLRAFMIGGIAEQIRDLGQRLEWLAALAPGNPLGAIPRDAHATGELQRLAEAIERTLLTLAIERGSHALSGFGGPGGAVREPALVAPAGSESLAPGSPGVKPAAAASPVALRLPHGRTVEVACAPGDLSISAALKTSDGDWEPHVRAYLAQLVQPDWVCLDIGANLGAHTLSLAVLARSGRVVAFEPDPANFALLEANAQALAPPCAAIETVPVALWDSPGRLIFGGADELAGCSFIAEDADAKAVEQRLRAVVDTEAIRDVTLHMRLSEVAALPLDAWVAQHGLDRLDIIKLDVEGAEIRVIRGALATLRQYRPVLLVEYNPACAKTYFGQPEDALFRELAGRFASIHILEPDGTPTPVPDWAALQARLTSGKGWEDLVCLPSRDGMCQPARPDWQRALVHAAPAAGSSPDRAPTGAAPASPWPKDLGMDRLSLQEKVNQLPWHHQIDFGNGVTSPGKTKLNVLQAQAAVYFKYGVAGKSLLDVGCWDGFNSFEANRLGASRVLATDHFAWSEACWGSREAFETARAHLAPDVEVMDIDVMDLTPERVGQFDIVLFAGVFYHLRHPFLVLERLARLATSTFIVETHLDALDQDRPAMIFYPGRELADDPTNWWGPNPPCVTAMLRDIGFQRVDYVQHPLYPTRGIFHGHVR